MVFRGIFPPAITPFKENEEIDEDKLKDFLDFLIKRGVHGIFLLGTNGEAPMLTTEEKKLVMKIAVEHVNGKVPVIVGAGAVSTKEAIELGRFAEKVGADAIHVVTPYYYPVTQEGLIKHYSKIAMSVEIPVIVYYIPSLTHNRMEIKTLKKIASFPRIAGLKDSSKDLAWFHAAIVEIKSVRDDFSFLCGSDALIFTYLQFGASGAVSAIANVFPELVVELYNSFIKGDHEEALMLQDKVLRIRRIFKGYPYMSAIKAALKLRGFDFGNLRSPLQSLEKADLEKLKLELQMLKLI